MTTKLAKILQKKKMTNRDLQRSIQFFFRVKIYDARLWNIVNGKQLNYTLKTAHMISEVLGVKIDDICEYKQKRKKKPTKKPKKKAAKKKAAKKPKKK